MLFIPFLENAFKHGVTIGHASSIDVAIAVRENKLIFICTNTNYSAVRKLEVRQGGIGLENVKRRLQLVHPGKHELLMKTESGKYHVNLQLDLL